MWPDPNVSSANTSYLIDAATEKVAFRVQAPKTGNLGAVKFRLGTVTTGDTLKVSFQDAGASGDPDGTPDQYRTIVVANTDDDRWVVTGVLTADGTDGGAKRSVTRGDWFFVVIEFNSFVAGNLNIQGASKPVPIGNGAYGDHNTGTWVKNALAFCGIVYYDDNSFAYTPTCSPTVSQATNSLNTGTTPDEVALKFQVPVEVSCSGAWVMCDLDGEASIILYAADGTTVLASATFLSAERADTAVRQMEFLWGADVTLAAATVYYLAVKPTTATSLTVRYVDVPSAGDMDALPGGQTCIWSQRTDGGAWADTTTKRLKAAVMLNKVHDGVGGGGGGLRMAGHGGLAA